VGEDGVQCGGLCVMNKRILFLILALLLTAACGVGKPYVKQPPKKRVILSDREKDRKFYVVNGKRYYPLPDAEGFEQVGKASWYGGKFHGRTTSNGERYDMYKISAAHKTLPFDTYVSVLNLTNRKKIVVRINDRGPFVKGRIIDLSYAAAKDIGMIGPGVAKVKITALGKEVGKAESKTGAQPILEAYDFNQGQFTIQVGAFTDEENARRLATRLKVLFDYVEVTGYEDLDRGLIYKVRVSKSDTLKKANEIEKELEGMGFEKAFIVSL